MKIKTIKLKEWDGSRWIGVEVIGKGSTKRSRSLFRILIRRYR